MFLQAVGVCFFGYILLYPFFSEPNNAKDDLITNKDIMIIGIYMAIALGGVLYNSKTLGGPFYKDTASALVISFGRMVILIFAELLLLFIVKFFCIIPPMEISKYNYFADILWYFPVIQLPFYFFEYKKFHFSAQLRKLG
jgi:hypothetical protein